MTKKEKMKEAMSEAWRLKREAETHWSAKEGERIEVDFGMCLSMAIRGEKLNFYSEVETETKTETEVEIEFTLYANAFKGSGKAWAAVVETTKSGAVKGDSREWLDPVATEKSGYKTEKTYEEKLPVGTMIEANDSGTKTYDDRILYEVTAEGLKKVSERSVRKSNRY